MNFETQLIQLSDYIENTAGFYTRDAEKKKDLAQETILRALENQDKFKANTNLKGWLKVMMRNIFINDVNKKSTKGIKYDSEDFRVMTGERDFYTPEDKLNEGQIQSLIDDLIEEYRVPFQLHNAGYKYQEIADQLNIPIGTVKSRIFQARKILAGKIRA